MFLLTVFINGFVNSTTYFIKYLYHTLQSNINTLKRTTYKLKKYLRPFNDSIKFLSGQY